MNLHKAKGLEAAVVFLADPNGGFAPRVDDHIERTELKAHGWFKLVRKAEGKSWGGKLLGEHADWRTRAAEQHARSGGGSTSLRRSHPRARAARSSVGIPAITS